MAAATEVDICNSALGKLGVETITALADNNPRARLCNSQYNKIRDKVLYSHPWNFAVERASLTVDATAPTYGYTYRYPKPAGCLRVLEVDTDQAWEIEGDYILTDSSDCYIRYIKAVTDVAKFNPFFAEVLAIELAHDMAFPLTGNNTLKEQLTKDKKAQLAEARSMDAFESSVKQIQANDWLNARF